MGARSAATASATGYSSALPPNIDPFAGTAAERKSPSVAAAVEFALGGDVFVDDVDGVDGAEDDDDDDDNNTDVLAGVEVGASAATATAPQLAAAAVGAAAGSIAVVAVGCC